MSAFLLKATATRSRDAASRCRQNPPLGPTQTVQQNPAQRAGTEMRKFHPVKHPPLPFILHHPGTVGTRTEPAATSCPRAASLVAPALIYLCHPGEAGPSTQRDTMLSQHPDEFLKLLNRNQLHSGEASGGRTPGCLSLCSRGGAGHPVPNPVSPSSVPRAGSRWDRWDQHGRGALAPTCGRGRERQQRERRCHAGPAPAAATEMCFL